MKAILNLIAVICLMSLSIQSEARACTKDQAFNKMMAIGRAQQKLMHSAAGDNAKMLQVGELAKEVGDVGQVLADGKYTEACGYYDKIARKYNIDLKESAKGMVTMDQIRKDGGKKGGACSQSEASIRFMNMSQKMEDKAALGDIDRGVLGNFLNDASSHNDLMMSDPSAFCGKLDELAVKYSIDE